MSLVITSNEIPGSGVRTSEFQSPFSFHNHLDQPLKIPANSEVAVQSLKINKEGSTTLSPATIWYQYFGVPVAAAGDQDNYTSAPHYVDLNIESNREATTETAARDYITPALNRGVPNPETFGLATAAPTRDAQGNDFLGWDITFQQRTTGKGLDVKPQVWDNKFGTTGVDGGLSFNSASNTLTSTGKAGAARALNQAIGEDTPIALNEGEFIVDLTGLKPGGVNVNWGVGLTRCLAPPTNVVNDLYNTEATENYYPEIEADFLVGGFQDPGTVSGSRWLRGYHLVENSDNTEYTANTPLSMKNVDYPTNGSFAAAYDWSTNATTLQFTKLKYTVNNEDIKAEMYSASTATWHTLIDTTGVNATKDKRFKPVADTCRNLYPFVFIQGLVGATQPYITIDKWGGRSITNFTYASPANDWWAYLNSVNLQRDIGRTVDTRIYNKFDSVSITTNHTFKGINASGTFEDYEYILVVKPDPALYTPSDRALASLFLGYDNQVSVSKTSINASSVSLFTSTTVPELKSSTNVFVRLNNYNVQSYNAGQSTTSKIIYAAPRFSTGTDQSVGALFFEAPERLYIDLNNPSDMVSNMFDISLVNEDNTLATDLRGKTVCILHFRQKK
tara:strand:- start:1729 stop:3582 length:1854 start_codon:yes stop_codon:yes gene_type:complete